MQREDVVCLPKKVAFRDYSKYPSSILEACHFRDEYDDLPNAAFFALAEERGLYEGLIEMSKWEQENTIIKQGG